MTPQSVNLPHKTADEVEVGKIISVSVEETNIPQLPGMADNTAHKVIQYT